MSGSLQGLSRQVTPVLANTSTAAIARNASSKTQGRKEAEKVNAVLKVTVLSAYDLLVSEAPANITLTCLGKNISTGAPSARHKHRNSFRYDASATPLTIEAQRLEDLYTTNATLTVEYDDPQWNMSTKVPLVLNTLKIHETAWIILNLEEQNKKPESSSLALTDGSKQEGNGSTIEEETPTIRIQARLEGPYRPEIAALVSLGRSWFGLVDSVEHNIKTHLWPMLPRPSASFLLVPTVPLVTAVVVLSPVLVGCLVLLVPLLLPLLVLLIFVVLAGSGVAGLVYASTRTGRDHVGGMVSPLVQTILSTSSGQRSVYETGPRPSPVSVARVVCPKDRISKLLFSLTLDGMGSASYLLPLVGEALDIGWAPVQTVFVMAMYEHVSPNLKYLSFTEEMLPFTDVIPSATMGWLVEFGPELVTGQDNRNAHGVEEKNASALTSSGIGGVSTATPQL